MSKSIILFFSLFTFGFIAKAQKTYTYQDKRLIYKLIIDSVMSGDSANYECSVRSISIVQKSDHKLIQTIKPPENRFYCDLDKNEIFVVEDMNFDGLNDIRLIQFIPAAPNTPYYFWMFNKKTQKFVRNKAFDDITKPEFDYQKKLIYSSWRAGWNDRGASNYKIIGGEPILIEEFEIKPYNDDTIKRISITKKRINGKMRIVKKEIE